MPSSISVLPFSAYALPEAPKQAQLPGVFKPSLHASTWIELDKLRLNLLPSSTPHPTFFDALRSLIADPACDPKLRAAVDSKIDPESTLEDAAKKYVDKHQNEFAASHAYINGNTGVVPNLLYMGEQVMPLALMKLLNISTSVMEDGKCLPLNSPAQDKGDLVIVRRVNSTGGANSYYATTSSPAKTETPAATATFAPTAQTWRPPVVPYNAAFHASIKSKADKSATDKSNTDESTANLVSKKAPGVARSAETVMKPKLQTAMITTAENSPLQPAHSRRVTFADELVRGPSAPAAVSTIGLKSALKKAPAAPRSRAARLSSGVNSAANKLSAAVSRAMSSVGEAIKGFYETFTKGVTNASENLRLQREEIVADAFENSYARDPLSAGPRKRDYLRAVEDGAVKKIASDSTVKAVAESVRDIGNVMARIGTRFFGRKKS